MKIFTKDESDWIDTQVDVFEHINTSKDKHTDEEVKKAFDNFYETVSSWQTKYQTRHLETFRDIGYGYDGCLPGNNESFLGLYKELIGMVKDKRADMPIYYASERNGHWVEICEEEDGTKTIVRVIED